MGSRIQVRLIDQLDKVVEEYIVEKSTISRSGVSENALICRHMVYDIIGVVNGIFQILPVCCNRIQFVCSSDKCPLIIGINSPVYLTLAIHVVKDFTFAWLV